MPVVAISCGFKSHLLHYFFTQKRKLIQFPFFCSYDTKDMAYYNEDQAAYILDKGKYYVRVGDSSRNTSVEATIEVDDTARTEQLSNQMEVPDGEDLVEWSKPEEGYSYPTEEAEKEAAILRAEAKKEAMIREAEGKAQAIAEVQKATAEGLKYLNEAAPTESVLTLKSLEAFEKASDGQATKIIIPSEIQGIAGLSKSIVEIAKENG